jgi:polyisoprenoid-binding protein YceI
VRTARTGAAAKAGHDLLLEVTAWEATVDDDAVSLDADATSLRVREGTGGMQALGDDDIASIHDTIDTDILKKQAIAFRSTRITPGDDGSRHVEGELTLVGKTHPVAFDVTEDDAGHVTGRATLTPSEWGIKQYSILFGALKVADEVVVEVDGQSR